MKNLLTVGKTFESVVVYYCDVSTLPLHIYPHRFVYPTSMCLPHTYAFTLYLYVYPISVCLPISTCLSHICVSTPHLRVYPSIYVCTLYLRLYPTSRHVCTPYIFCLPTSTCLPHMHCLSHIYVSALRFYVCIPALNTCDFANSKTLAIPAV